MSKKGYIRKPKLAEPEPIERRCCKCNRKFMAKGRFNWKCPICTNADSNKMDYGSRYRVIWG